MVTRADIIWLGVSCASFGALVGGLILAIGMDLTANGQPLGIILMVPGVPIAGAIGWWQGKRLARQLAN